MFEHAPERRGGDSSKWNRWAGRDVIPLWVADQDFPPPPAVLAALQARLAHGVFGYPDPPAGLAGAAVAMLARHGHAAAPEHLVWLPSLVVGLNLCCRAFAGSGGRVVTTTPIYPPFLTAPGNQGAACVRVPMVERAGRWEHDPAALRTALAAGAGCVLLCLPHNPLGRAFDLAELRALAAVFADFPDTVVVSDEAWADLVLEPGRRHLPFAVAAPELAHRIVTLVSPAKAFNLPGLRLGAAVAADDGLRRRLRSAGSGLIELNPLGMHAAQAAWTDGWDWLAALTDHLRAQRDRACARLAGLPGIRLTVPEATYLLWLDCRGLGVADVERFFVEAGVGGMPGEWFAAPGHLRLNLSCTAALLDQALERIERAVRNRI